ncbi:hypothetical protein TBLA_0C01430 [Henningerozyma blattae CBS 6284]|uniref:V-type proton ATPase subunit a n=1 Tax=Henningerozyma blattae (strain ATCC 34711 / CBS 6284 / DSM 70876 / NBRC 10599 / NRRL Y-10934 / UCD 77-7) TaxID=1071380 RepID=I2H0Q6_HENB6|nr:hypothetical protein TBLA_0C01430 [Tetrapisispora blattae CBS 6284]CCH59958.1 hypothetical protein TBLA_0C01430 [Tetrapisispora blattae CBS 6284]
MSHEESIYRSAPMTYVQLYIPLETSKEVVSLFGRLGNIMFRDMNTQLNSFQRGYVSQLRKYEDIERLVTYLKDISKKYSGATWKYFLHYNEEGNEIVQPDLNTNLYQTLDRINQENINELIHDIQGFELRVRQLNDSMDDLQLKLNNFIEQRHVFFQCRRFLEINPGIVGRISRERRDRLDVDDFRLNSTDDINNADAISETLSDAFSFDNPTQQLTTYQDTNNIDEFSDDNYGFLEQGLHDKFMIAGSINRTKVEILNRILWRLLRGNLYFQNFPIEEPLIDDSAKNSNEKIEKDSFIIFTHGETLLNKAKRVIDSLDGKVYPLRNTNSQTINQLNDRISELQQIVTTTEQTLHTELLVVNDQLPLWSALVKREKYIYATLNLFRRESHGLVAEGWIPSSEVTLVSNSLKDHSESIGSEYTPVLNIIKTNKSPPTYYRTNKFTKGFQAIVDAYGVSTYREINPGLATIVTFPFLFAIMFGDTGHGFILFLIAIYFIINESKFDNMRRDEIFDMAYSGRYVLVLMGGFSIYTGILYNDIFSKSMTLFNSGWKWPEHFKEGDAIEATQIGVYPFGLDWAWHGTDNSLLFTNSYKMKLSILIGFIHMTYSFCFSYINYKNNNSRVDIIGNFIPGLIFMQSIFGYLSITIVYKWSKDWIKDGKPAPGLLNMLINMFLSPGVIDEQLYPGQGIIQKLLLIFALVCVPWLLLYKPLTLRKQNSRAVQLGYQDINDQRINESILDSQATAGDEMIITDFSTNETSNENAGSYDDNENKDEPKGFQFGDVMIHQVIHTIEFCLNCISHTASYLRLWALSLAHAQLSTVLWDMTISNAFSSKNSGSPLAVAKVVFLFGMWFVLTVCILVLMEGTSAMLHALRLIWVEAMSKFFEGEGYAYEPFTFAHLEDDDEQ